MRKRQTRKIPFRHKLLMGLREMKDMPLTIVDSQGHEIALNIAKHLLLNKPYRNNEYQRELMRHAQQMSK